jgi:hypothetical protein
MRKDYRSLWELPPPLPRRWPRFDLALLAVVVALVLSCGTFLWPELVDWLRAR